MEKWRDIPGYEGIYEASTEGRIRSKEGKTTHSRRHGTRHWKQRVLKQKMQPDKNGRIDARIILWKDGSPKTFLVSRLVAMTWVDGYSPELTVNHIDGNPLNNVADNLEWISIGDNIRHGFSIGLYHTKIPVCLKNGKQELKFDSMADAGRFIGRGGQYVSCCLKRGKTASGIHGERYAIMIGGDPDGQDGAGKGQAL